MCITKQDLGAETHSNLNRKYMSKELTLAVSLLCHCARSKVRVEQERVLTQETCLSGYEPKQDSGKLGGSSSSTWTFWVTSCKHLKLINSVYFSAFPGSKANWHGMAQINGNKALQHPRERSFTQPCLLPNSPWIIHVWESFGVGAGCNRTNLGQQICLPFINTTVSGNTPGHT